MCKQLILGIFFLLSLQQTTATDTHLVTMETIQNIRLFWYDLMNNKSDPRVKDWPMMSSPLPTILICLSYAYFVKVKITNFFAISQWHSKFLFKLSEEVKKVNVCAVKKVSGTASISDLLIFVVHGPVFFNHFVQQLLCVVWHFTTIKRSFTTRFTYTQNFNPSNVVDLSSRYLSF